MKIKRVFLFLQLFQLVACTPTNPVERGNLENPQVENLVRQVYNNYKTTVSNGDGNAAAQCVSSNTIRYYSSLIDMVNNADSIKLESADLLVKFSVLAIRHSVNWGMLRAMNGQMLFIYAIENGMIGREAVKTEIGSVKFENENHATGELLMNGKQTGMFTDFFKESGIWKVDLVSSLKANENGLKKMIVQTNMPENQSILRILKETFGEEPGHEVWQPANSNAK